MVRNRQNEAMIFWNTIIDRKAITEGHFYYGDATGDRYHTGYFVDTDLFFQHPIEVRRVAEALYNKFGFKNKVNYVATPNNRGGFLLAHNLADRFNAQVLLVNRSRRVLNLPPDIEIKGTAVIVDDGINTGSSVLQLSSLLGRAGMEVLGIGIFIERYIGNVTDFENFVSIISVSRDYRLVDKDKEGCALCKEYVDVTRKLDTEKDDRERAPLVSRREELELQSGYGND